MEEQTSRSNRTLHVLLVLSFISNGLSFFAYIVMGCFLPQFRRMVDSGNLPLPGEMRETYELMLNIPQLYYVLAGLLFAFAFVGCVLMWKQRKMGFHYYTIAKLLLIAVPVVFLGRSYLNMGDIMMSALFVTWYAIMLKPFSSEPEGEGPAGDTEDSNGRPEEGRDESVAGDDEEEADRPED